MSNAAGVIFEEARRLIKIDERRGGFRGGNSA